MLTRFQLAKQSEITATWVRDIAQRERVPILVLTRRFQLAKQSETTATWTGIQTVQRYSTSFVLSRFGSKLKVKHRPAKHNETIVTWGRDTDSTALHSCQPWTISARWNYHDQGQGHRSVVHWKISACKIDPGLHLFWT